MAETYSYYVDLIIPAIRYFKLCYRLFFFYLSVKHFTFLHQDCLSLIFWQLCPSFQWFGCGHVLASFILVELILASFWFNSYSNGKSCWWPVSCGQFSVVVIDHKVSTFTVILLSHISKPEMWAVTRVHIPYGSMDAHKIFNYWFMNDFNHIARKI